MRPIYMVDRTSSGADSCDLDLSLRGGSICGNLVLEFGNFSLGRVKQTRSLS